MANDNFVDTASQKAHSGRKGRQVIALSLSWIRIQFELGGTTLMAIRSVSFCIASLGIGMLAAGCSANSVNTAQHGATVMPPAATARDATARKADYEYDFFNLTDYDLSQVVIGEKCMSRVPRNVEIKARHAFLDNVDTYNGGLCFIRDSEFYVQYTLSNGAYRVVDFEKGAGRYRWLFHNRAGLGYLFYCGVHEHRFDSKIFGYLQFGPKCTAHIPPPVPQPNGFGMPPGRLRLDDDRRSAATNDSDPREAHGRRAAKAGRWRLWGGRSRAR